MSVLLKFKVGDRVKVVSSIYDSPALGIGAIGTVRTFYGDVVGVEVQAHRKCYDDDGYWAYEQDELELLA